MSWLGSRGAPTSGRVVAELYHLFLTRYLLLPNFCESERKKMIKNNI